jgi:D-alanine--poly(phosphoribitol) ligase subunit 1
MSMLCPLLERFHAVLEVRSSNLAISSADADVTYSELWESAVSWRDRLLALNPAKNVPVAVISDGSPALIPAFLGVRAAGLVPLLVDAMLPPQRRSDMIRISRTAIILDTASDSVTRTVDWSPQGLPAEAGYVTFSSGSQGRPKGIIGNVAGVASFLEWEREALGLDPTVRGALLTSPSFDVVLRDMLLPLMAGGVLCVPGVGVRTNPGSVISWLEESEVNVVHLVPSLSTRWVAASKGTQLRALRWSLFAGEPLYARHVERWRSVAPSTHIVNLYGPSETTLAKFWHLLEEPSPQGLQPVGRSLPGTRLVRDQCDSGILGGSFRITLETPDGSLGYLPDGVSANDSQALMRKDGVTRFVSQDRGRIGPDGLLTVEGRLDGLVKRNGIMVDVTDVTAQALVDPDVAQACCLQINANATGSIVLAVEVTPEFSMRRLTGNLRRTLGPAMPNEVVAFDQLPMLPNGKIDRSAVLRNLEQREDRR